jgi:hypothetical protein
MSALTSIVPMARDVRPVTDFRSAASAIVTARVLDAARLTGEAMVALLDPDAGSRLGVQA